MQTACYMEQKRVSQNNSIVYEQMRRNNLQNIVAKQDLTNEDEVEITFK